MSNWLRWISVYKQSLCINYSMAEFFPQMCRWRLIEQICQRGKCLDQFHELDTALNFALPLDMCNWYPWTGIYVHACEVRIMRNFWTGKMWSHMNVHTMGSFALAKCDRAWRPGCLLTWHVPCDSSWVAWCPPSRSGDHSVCFSLDVSFPCRCRDTSCSPPASLLCHRPLASAEPGTVAPPLSQTHTHTILYT